MAVTLDEKTRERHEVSQLEDLLLLEAKMDVHSGSGDGGGGTEEASGDGGGSSPPKQMPLVPAIILIVALGALLTFLGMLTQIWANLAGAQLPGS